jgi:hypothetical protein
LNNYIHRYQLSWETERTDLRVTEYRYPPFDRGWRKTSETRVTPKKKHKNNVRKNNNNQPLYAGSFKPMDLFSLEKLSK